MKRIQSVILLPLLSTILLSCLVVDLSAQQRTVGLLQKTDAAFDGYTLFSPIRSTTTWLIDTDGRVVQTWESPYPPGDAVYLLENGHLLRTGNVGGVPGTFGVGGGSGGVVQEFAWDGTLIWEYRYADDSVRQHHDAIKLPNGNVLLIAWELVQNDELVARGFDPARIPSGGLWADHLVEIRPEGATGGEIVWQWHALDHIIQDRDPLLPNYGIPAEHPGRIDVDFLQGRVNQDWLHVNGIAYNAALDQILFSSPVFNEIWIVDHNTTIEEAAGVPGDFLYRWGNPRTYGAGTINEQRLFFQHNPTWIPAGYPGEGNILIYNNGQGRPGGAGAAYSTVEEIVPPVDESGSYFRAPNTAFGPTESLWSYSAPQPAEFYSPNISGAQRQPNGNTLICEGVKGRFFEVTPSGEIVWEYINPVAGAEVLQQGDSISGNTVFRAMRYGKDHPGFAGHDLTPGDFIEGSSSDVHDSRIGAEGISATIYPNPIEDRGVLYLTLLTGTTVSLSLSNMMGEVVAEPLSATPMESGEHAIQLDLSSLPAGLYFCRIRAGNYVESTPILKSVE